MPDVTWAAGLHWSYSERAWCGFFAQQLDGTVVCRRELSWLEVVPEDAAVEILDSMATWGIPRLQFLALDAKMFPRDDKRRVQTVSTTFMEARLPIKRSHEDWIAAWHRVRSWLAPRRRPDGTFVPTLRVHRECEYLIRTLPTVISSDTDVDMAAEAEECIPAKAISYYVMARPMPPRLVTPAMPPDAIGHEVEKIRRTLRAR